MGLFDRFGKGWPGKEPKLPPPPPVEEDTAAKLLFTRREIPPEEEAVFKQSGQRLMIIGG